MEKMLKWYHQSCEEGDFNRIGIMAFILLLQSCLAIPATIALHNKTPSSRLAYQLTTEKAINNMKFRILRDF